MGFPLVDGLILAEGVGNAPTSAMPILFSRQVQPAYICLPSEMVGWQELHLRPPRSERGRLLLTLHLKLAARVGLAPTPCGLTNRRATLTPPGNEIGAAGRIPTCIVPLRRRMPDVFDHGSNLKWSERQDFHLRPPGPKPGALKTELRAEKMADPKGLAPSAFPQTTGRSAN